MTSIKVVGYLSSVYEKDAKISAIIFVSDPQGFPSLDDISFIAQLFRANDSLIFHKKQQLSKTWELLLSAVDQAPEW